jgi:hypothetical protein
LLVLSEWFGVLIAVISSSLGGTAAAVTRYLVGNADPITLLFCGGELVSYAYCPLRFS